METWARGLELFNAERAKHDSAQFYDMDYFELIKDPIGTVEGIYRHFGIEMTDAARAAHGGQRRREQAGSARAQAHLLTRGLRPDRRRGQGALQGL